MPTPLNPQELRRALERDPWLARASRNRTHQLAQVGRADTERELVQQTTRRKRSAWHEQATDERVEWLHYAPAKHPRVSAPRTRATTVATVPIAYSTGQRSPTVYLRAYDAGAITRGELVALLRRY